jgi:hypothetical protein
MELYIMTNHFKNEYEIKVLFHFQIVDTFDIRLFAKSHLKDVNGDEFGSYSTGPTPDPRKTDLTVRGACIEFRCPGYIKDGNKEIFDLDTAIDVRMVTSNRNLRCKIRSV